MKKRLIMAFLAGFLYLANGNAVIFADGGEELPPPRSLPKYGNAVKAVETDDTLLLTKDSVAAVKKFFDTNKQDGDRLEDSPADGSQGFQMSFFKKIDGREKSVPLVRFEEKTPDANLHPALGELKGQVLMGKHSEAEYQALEDKYKTLHLAFFRQVSDDQGRSVSEGESIYRKAYNQAHGKDKSAVQAGGEDQAAGKAQAQEMKKKMQEMKAKGDIAGMAAMAQQFNTSPGQTKQGAAAMDEMIRDTWDLWVKCLEDIEKAAYRTRLKYNASPKQ
nr:hypothetical protein [Desulfobacula sp.]